MSLLMFGIQPNGVNVYTDILQPLARDTPWFKRTSVSPFPT